MGCTNQDTPKKYSFDSCVAEIKSRETPVKQVFYDPDEAFSLTATIIYGLAELENTSPENVGPPFLYDSVDITAVEEELFTPESTELPRGTIQSLSFCHLGYFVTLTEIGVISFYDISQNTSEEVKNTDLP